MMPSRWVAISSHLASDQEHIPTTFQLKLHEFVLEVTRDAAYPGRWIAHFHPFFHTHLLGPEAPEEAQQEALAMARDYVRRIIVALDSVK
jgi:hypothetical protein